MVTVSKGLRGKNPEKYYLDYAKKNQLLCGLEPGAFWHGTLAAILGLTGKIKKKHLKNLLDGYSPSGRVKLTNNAGTRSKKYPRRKSNDIVFASDKSVSVLAALSPEWFRKQIVQAHENAVRKSLTDYEPVLGFSRRDEDGKVVQLSPIAWSLTTEFLNRSNEPHIHTHALTINLALRPDLTFGALESRAFFEFKTTLDEAYHHHLAAELRSLGLDVTQRQRRTSIPEIPIEVWEGFSTRRWHIKNETESQGFTSARARSVAQELTRSAKRNAPPDLFQRFAAKGRSLGFGPEKAEQVLKQALARSPFGVKPENPKKPEPDFAWYRKRPGLRIKPKHRRYRKIYGPARIQDFDIRVQQTRIIGKFYFPLFRILYPKKRRTWGNDITTKIDNPFLKVSIARKRVFPGQWGRSPLSKITAPAIRVQIKPWAINGLIRLTELTRDRLERRRVEREAQRQKKAFQKEMEKQHEQTKTR